MTDIGRGEALAALLRARIRSGEIAPGARLPSRRALADEHGDYSARRAMAVLAAEGLTVPSRGAWTKVADPLPAVALSVEERLAALEAWRAAHEERHP